MKQVVRQDGICFVIISAFGKVYFLEAVKLFVFWERKENNGRKSIRKDELEDASFPISLDTHRELIILVLLNSFIFRRNSRLSERLINERLRCYVRSIYEP